MQWLFPAFLAGALAALLPLVLHFLRARIGRPVPLPSLRFLEAATRTTRYHWVRRWIVLLLRMAVFALLAAAFARPYLTAFFSGRRATVLVVDTSCSMQAGGRWNELRRWARAQLGEVGSDETMGLLVTDPRPTWVVPPGGDPAAVLAAFEALRPGWGAARVEPAVRVAADVLAASPAQQRRLVFVGDHQAGSWIGTDFKQPLAAGVEALFPAPAAPVDGQAFLKNPRVIRALSGGLSAEVDVVTSPGNAQTRRLRVFAEAAREPWAETTGRYAAGDSQTVRLALPATSAPAHWVRLCLDADELAADDCVYALVPPPVETARRMWLDAAPAGAAFDHAGTAFAASADLPPKLTPQPLPDGEWPTPAVAVLRNAASLEGKTGERLDAFLAAGGQVLVLLDKSMAEASWWSRHDLVPTAVKSADGPARLHEWSAEHPLIAPLAKRGLRGLVGWQFRRAWSWPRTSTEAVAFWQDGTVAIGEARMGAGRMLLCGFSAERSDGDWPIEAAFVPFLHRAAAHLLERAVRQAPTAEYRVGEAILLPPGRGRWRMLAGPNLETEAREAEQTVAVNAPGVYAFEREAGTSWWAVNLTAEESDLAPWSEGTPWLGLVPPATAGATGDPGQRQLLAGADAERKTGLWGWCLAGAAALLLLELALANRTAR